MRVLLVQDEVDRLDKGIRDRHAAEMAALEARQAEAAVASGADDGAAKLADSLSEATLHSNAHAKVCRHNLPYVCAELPTLCRRPPLLR